MVSVEVEAVAFDVERIEDRSLLLFLRLFAWLWRFPPLTCSVITAAVVGLIDLYEGFASSIFISTSSDSILEVIVLCLLKVGMF